MRPVQRQRYVEETALTDYVWAPDGSAPAPAAGLVIPASVEDLAANGLLGEDYPPTCWERSLATLMARKDELTGLAVVSFERIEAYILYLRTAPGKDTQADPPPVALNRHSELHGEIVSLRSLIEDGGARLRHLLSRLSPGTYRLPKVHPIEMSSESLEALGFRSAGGHLLFAAKARPD